jgi:hypothetical protein
VFNKDISPVAFLMHDASGFAIIIVPWCRRFACEALNPTKSSVLHKMNRNSFANKCVQHTWIVTEEVISPVHFEASSYSPCEPRCGMRESSFPENMITEIPWAVALVASSVRNAIGLC